MAEPVQTVRRLRNARLRVLAVVIAVFAAVAVVSGIVLGEPRVVLIGVLWTASAGLLWWLGAWRPAAPVGGEPTGPYARALGVGVLAVALFLGAALLLPR